MCVCIYICITESLCCTAEISTALQVNYASIIKNKRGPQVWQSGLPGRNQTADKVKHAVFLSLSQSLTHLKEIPAISNMSLAAVVSLLSWYLSDMKITSFIP